MAIIDWEIDYITELFAVGIKSNTIKYIWANYNFWQAICEQIIIAIDFCVEENITSLDLYITDCY